MIIIIIIIKPSTQYWYLKRETSDGFGRDMKGIVIIFGSARLQSSAFKYPSDPVNHLNAWNSASIYASPKRATTSKDLQVGRFRCNKPVLGVHHGLWPKEQSHAMHPWSPLPLIAHHQQQAEWGPSVSPTVKGLAVRSFPSPISISS